MDEFLRRAVAYVKRTGNVQPNENGMGDIAPTSADAPVLRELADGICIAYVVDEPEGLVYIQNRHLQDTGVSLDELHMIGLQNLKAKCDKELRLEKHGPIYGLFLDGNFEASVILLEHIWQGELFPLVEESFTIAIPARDILAFCDSSSAEGIKTLTEMVLTVFDGGDHLLSRNLFSKAKAQPA